MKSVEKIENHITNWLKNYLNNSIMNGFVIGVSGGVDSAVTSTLCAKTSNKVLCLEMPILQDSRQENRARKHIEWLKKNFPNVTSYRLSLKSFGIKSLPVGGRIMKISCHISQCSS